MRTGLIWDKFQTQNMESKTHSILLLHQLLSGWQSKWLTKTFRFIDVDIHRNKTKGELPICNCQKSAIGRQCWSLIPMNLGCTRNWRASLCDLLSQYVGARDRFSFVQLTMFGASILVQKNVESYVFFSLRFRTSA